MIILLSPSKTLDFSNELSSKMSSLPVFEEKANQIVKVLKKYNPKKLVGLMSISESLAQLTYERFQLWNQNEGQNVMKQAVFAYKGDVYTGLSADSFTESDLNHAQEHLRILSGIYGILRPLDQIQPYRLEMGTKIKVGVAANLYEFWKKPILKELKKDLKFMNSNLIINLASNEYAKSVDFKLLNPELVSPEFKEFDKGSYRMVSFFAKKARGSMASYIIRNRIIKAEELLAFNEDGYVYNPKLSLNNKPVFTRG